MDWVRLTRSNLYFKGLAARHSQGRWDLVRAIEVVHSGPRAVPGVAEMDLDINAMDGTP